MEATSVLTTAASLLLAGLNLTSSGGGPPADSSVYKTTIDLCRDMGLPCETHTVETEDGYQLTAHRVPVPPGVERRGALLAISALTACSDSFFMFPPPTNMPLTLANAGYDIMLGNLRGTIYSTGHRRWSRSQPQYWNFTLDDVGEYDMEALVELTQRVTGEPRPFYLGYSAGAGALYTWLQRRPRAQHVLRGAMLWGPSVFYAEPHSDPLMIYHLLPEATIRAFWATPGDMLPRSRGVASLVWHMCRRGAPLRFLCEAAFQFLTGVSVDSAGVSQLELPVSHISCGCPTTVFAHYAQNIRAKRLQAFDFGRQENLRRYGSERPPEYQVRNSTLPTAFFLGTQDRFVSFEEGMRQIRMMPSNVKRMVVPLEGYDHFHFLFDKNVSGNVHEKMLSFMSDL